MDAPIVFYWATDDIQYREEGEGDNLTRFLSGTVVKYGDVATVKVGGIVVRERIEPGAFGPVSDMDLTAVIQHERSRPVGRLGYGLTLTDTATEMRADLRLPDTTDGRDTYTNFKEGIIRGISPEFLPVKSAVQNGVLVRQQAKLLRIGLVDKGAYPDSKLVEARAAEIEALTPKPQRFFRIW